MPMTHSIGQNRENQIAKRNEKNAKHLERLKNNVSGAIHNATPKQIFDDGLTITAALSIDRVATKMILLAELTRTWRATRLPESRSWQNQTDLQSAIDDVIDVFPSMKIEEFANVMKMIRIGQITLYGRFDTPTMIGALRDYENTYTTTFRENQHHERAHREQWLHQNEITAADKQRFKDFVKSLNLPRETKTLDELGGSIQLTEREVIEATKPFHETNENAEKK